MDPQFHENQLQHHCRVCGIATHRHKSTQSCEKYARELMTAFGLDVSLDSRTIHPTTFCTPCYAVMGRLRKPRNVRSALVLYDWSKHRDDCKVDV